MSNKVKGLTVRRTTRDIFEFDRLNRPIVKNNVEKLKKSYKEKYLARPIDVVATAKNRFKIMDGQHRYTASKELGMDKFPVYYIVRRDWDIKDVRRLNSNQSNWGWSHILASECKAGNNEYLKVKEFINEFGLSVVVSASLLNGGTGSWTDTSSSLFKNGYFKVRDEMGARVKAKMVNDFSFFESYKSPRFVNAVIELSSNPDYNHSRMLKKMEYQQTKLVKCTDKNEYLKLLVKLYNFRSTNKGGGKLLVDYS